jgi:hypothetical protein
MDILGNCGGPIPRGLPVLVGDAVHVCPESHHKDAEVQLLADLVPSRWSPGMLDGVPLLSLPPRLRGAVTMAKTWLRVYESRR